MEPTSRIPVSANIATSTPTVTPGPLDVAFGYALLGWPVFPLVPGGKKPLYRSPHSKGARCGGRWAGCGRDGHGVLDATVDLAVITEWWRRQPRANVGIACGVTAAGCGPDVIDVDVKDGARGAESHASLRAAGLLRGKIAVALTPSGGWHLYYEGSAQGNGVVRGFGVDFRSTGGYVVGPGSVTPQGGYRWYQVPSLATGATIDFAAVRDYLKPPPPPRSPLKPPRLLDQSLDGLAGWVAGQEHGNRQAGLHWACCKALEGGHTPGDLEQLADAARVSGLAEADIRKAVGSACRKLGAS
jgi:hypothetical protein